MAKINRPLAPHLFIYNFQLTSFLSICHRISGTMLVFFIGFIMSLENFDRMVSEFFCFYDYLYLFDAFFYWFLLTLFYFVTGSLSFHILNGIRHLMWDLKYGLEIRNVTTSGIFILVVVGLYIFLLSV